MGINESKLSSKVPKTNIQEEGSIPSTPILTSKISKDVIQEVDPRSPSKHIARTPIQLNAAEEFQESDYQSGQTGEPDIKIQYILGIDPRSPTTDFQRTPIVINDTTVEQLPIKIRNKNLDTVRKLSVLNTPTSNNLVIPKLLESSPLTSKLTTNKRRSLVGVLETNIDYTETDLDVVILEKCVDKDSTLIPKGPKQYSANTSESKNLDPRSPTTDFVRTPLQITKEVVEKEIGEIAEVENNVDSKPELTIDPTIGLHNSTTEYNITLESLKILAPKQKNKYLSENIQSALVTPPILETVNQRQVKSEITPINITADITELDKKLTNLIYEDKNSLVYSRTVKLKEQVRFPLGDRNLKELTKSTSKLKVSNKPKKSESQISTSKIPILKEKQNIGVQCENTPPMNYMEKRKQKKTRKSQWDTDNTLVI